MNGEQQHYDAQTYAGDRADDVHRSMRNLPEEDRSTRAEVEAHIAADQSNRLAPQVRMGDDRAIGSTPNWAAMTSTELHTAATERNNPDTADDLGRAFNDGGNRLADAANRLLAAVAKLDAAWTGKAAEAARGALLPLADSVGQAGVAAQLMSAQMARQTAAASEVRKLPQPQEFNYQAELQTALANPNPVAGLADMEQRRSEAEAVRKEQVRFLEEYTRAMVAVDAQTPSFVEPPASLGGGEDGRHRITAGTVGYRGPNTAADLGRDSPAPPAVGHTVGGGGGSGMPVGGVIGGPGGATPPGVGTGTGTAGFTPGPAPAPPGLPVGPPGLPVGQPGPAAPPGPAGGPGVPFGPFGGAPVHGGGGGGGGVSGRGTGPGGPPGGSGSPGRGAGSMTGGALGAGGEPVAGARGGGAGSMAGGRAGGGLGAGGAMGGRGARDEEDSEHRRPSYLIEGDPEGAFGTDELTSPPVIGQEPE